MDLVLHVADDNGLINLAGIVAPGAHFTVARNENTGVVRLTPVKVATTAAIQQPVPVVEPSETEPVTGTTPWDQ